MPSKTQFTYYACCTRNVEMLSVMEAYKSETSLQLHRTCWHASIGSLPSSTNLKNYILFVYYFPWIQRRGPLGGVWWCLPGPVQLPGRGCWHTRPGQLVYWDWWNRRELVKLPQCLWETEIWPVGETGRDRGRGEMERERIKLWRPVAELQCSFAKSYSSTYNVENVE